MEANGKVVDVADVALDFGIALPGNSADEEQHAAASPVNAKTARQKMLHLATQLLAEATRMTADVLLAALAAQGPGQTSPDSLGKLRSCTFPAPEHWTMWLKDNVQQQRVSEEALVVSCLHIVPHQHAVHSCRIDAICCDRCLLFVQWCLI